MSRGSKAPSRKHDYGAGQQHLDDQQRLFQHQVRTPFSNLLGVRPESKGCGKKAERGAFRKGRIPQGGTMTMPTVTPDKFDAVLFDLDGVITATARIHASAWKQAFDEILQKRAGDGSFEPFDKQSDYEDYVDGKPRYDGTQSFLESRHIDMPAGSPDDPPGKATVWGIANRKNELFEEALKEERVDVFKGTVDWVSELRRSGLRTAVVSSSSHCKDILQNAGISSLFDARMDGEIADRLNLEGKPAPDTYLKAAEMLGVEARRAVVVEDALAGVEAGRSGGFGLVIGVDRKHDADLLRAHGADIVVSDLKEMLSR
jgi:beta-phosphoglucomutase family hydrolase